MAERVTDPELLKLLNASEEAPQSLGERVTDPALLRQLNGEADSSAGGYLTATTGGIIEGIPIAGPYLRAGADRAAALARSMTHGGTYDSQLAAIQERNQGLKQDHPWVDTGSQVAGGVLGTLPAVAAAPALFGAGTGGIAARTLASATSGGIIGGADAAVRSDGDWNAIRKGGTYGAAFGAGAPAAGMAVGAGARKLMDMVGGASTRAPGMSSAATSMLADDLRNAGGVDPVRARLAELGPESMLLDAAPSFTGRAQGLAILPDTRQAVVQPVTTRAAGANARLGEDVNRALGPAVDPASFEAARSAAYSEVVPPLYREALSQPVTVDTSGILQTIGRLGATEKGGADRALQRAWSLLHHEAEVPGVGRAMIPDRRPEALHNVKEALDGMIAQVQAQQGSAAASELRALSTVRSGVNEALERQVPGYANANRTAQGYFQQRDAFEGGQRLLSGGTDAPRPAQVASDTAAMAPGVAQAQRLGLRAEIDRHMGTQLNDRVALRRDLLGEGDYNRARMRTVFGEEPTEQLAGAVERESAFDQAFNDIVRNSQTAQRQAAAEGVAPRKVTAGQDAAGTVVAGALGGYHGAAAAALSRLARLGATSAGRASDIARNKELAKAVTRRQDDDLMKTLLDMLNARGLYDDLVLRNARRAEIGANAVVRSQGEQLRSQSSPASRFGFGGF